MGDSTELSIGMPLLPLQMFLSIAKSICKRALFSGAFDFWLFNLLLPLLLVSSPGFHFPVNYSARQRVIIWQIVCANENECECVCALGACEYFSVRVCECWRGLWILIENFAIERCSNCSLFNFKACWNYYFSECGVLLDSVKCFSKWFETGLQQQQQQYSLFTVLADSSFRFFSFSLFFFIFIFFGHYRAERAAPGP